MNRLYRRSICCPMIAAALASLFISVPASAEGEPDSAGQESPELLYGQGGSVSPPITCGERYLGSSREYQLTVAHGYQRDVWYRPYILGWKDNEPSILAGANVFEGVSHPQWASLTDDGIRMTVVEGPRTRYYRPPGTYYDVQLTWNENRKNSPLLELNSKTEWQRPARVKAALKEDSFFEATRLEETRTPDEIKRGFPDPNQQEQMPQFARKVMRRANELVSHDKTRRASRLLSWFHTAALHDYRKQKITGFDDLELESITTIHAVAPNEIRTLDASAVELPFSRTPQDVKEVELKSAVDSIEGLLEDDDLIQAAGKAVLAAQAMRVHKPPEKRLVFFRKLRETVHERALAAYESNQPKTVYRATKMLEWVLLNPTGVLGFGATNAVETIRTANGLELPETEGVAAALNDYAFIAQKRPVAARYDPLLVLRTVVEFAPGRAVAHLNLADRLMHSIGRGSFTEPERVVGLYRDYIRLRKKAKKPVIDRVSPIAEPEGVKQLAEMVWEEGVQSLSEKKQLSPTHRFLFAVRAYQMYREERGESDKSLSKSVKERLDVPNLALERAEAAWKNSRPALAGRWLEVYRRFPPNPKKYWEEGARSVPDKWKKRSESLKYQCF